MDRIRLIGFILLCINLPAANACGPFYPSNEAIRYHMVDPLVYIMPGYELYHFSMGSWPLWREEPDYIMQSDKMVTVQYQNIDYWNKRTKFTCDMKDIYAAVYCLNGEFNNPKSVNSFVRYLYAHDTAALHYLQFADAAEEAYVPYDPWERMSQSVVTHGYEMLHTALDRAANTSDKVLRERYWFQAVKMSGSNDPELNAHALFEKYFESSDYRGMEYFWALSRFIGQEPDSARNNYVCALSFKHAPDRRLRVDENFYRSIPLERVLPFAKNKEERAAIYALYAFKNPGRALSLIQKAYWLDPKSDEIPFLMMRELSKLEYWVYTPYFQNFESYYNYWARWDGDATTVPVMHRKSAADRRYAKDVSAFINAIPCNKKWDGDAWQMMQSYLMIMCEDYANAEIALDAAQEKVKKNSDKWHTIEMLQSFCAMSQHSDSADNIINRYQNELIYQDKKENASYFFGMARLLEYSGHTTEAAVLLSKLNPYHNSWDHEETFWRTAKLNQTLIEDFYDDYIFYLDAQYSSDQLASLIATVEQEYPKNKFNGWLYGQTHRDLPRLYDLLGTNYIRQNQLQNALDAFKKVNDTLYSSKNFPFVTYLDANPFAATINSEHGRTKYDTVRYDKEGITRQLIKYLNLASDTTRRNRDYYYFLAANCYYNMTQYGNSWMMRRYFWTQGEMKTGLTDDKEYFTCKLAIHYYLKAKEVSHSKKFSALCLRMAGKCEERSMDWQTWNGGYKGITQFKNYDDAFKMNPYYTQLKNKYPAYYSDLISNCNSFSQYFACAEK